MPRPNRPRDVLAEDHLATRVALERQRRGWTYDGMAQRMTDAGCPVDPSAIYKIEKGRPRRRIVVDELVAMSRVFDVRVEELLTDPQLARERRVVELLDEYQRAGFQWGQLRAEWLQRLKSLQDELEELGGSSPAIRKVMTEHLETKFTFGREWAADLVELFSGRRTNPSKRTRSKQGGKQ